MSFLLWCVKKNTISEFLCSMSVCVWLVLVKEFEGGLF